MYDAKDLPALFARTHSEFDLLIYLALPPIPTMPNANTKF